MVVGVLCGCGCSKESKFTGTWEEKIDEEKLKVEEEKQAEVKYGKPESEVEKKILGQWETDDKKGRLFISRKDGSLSLNGKYFTLLDENGNEIYSLKYPERTTLRDFVYKYDSRNNTIVLDAVYYRGTEIPADDMIYRDTPKGSVYKKIQEDSLKDNFKPDKLVLNSDKTGTITENDNSPTEIVWAMTSDGNPNTIVVRANSALSKDLVFTLDPEKDVLTRGTTDSIYYYERSK